MCRLLLYTFLTLLYACNNDSKEQNQWNQDNSKQPLTDIANNELKLTTRFNSFDTTVGVLFWDTKDSINDIQKKNYEGFIAKQDILAPQILQKIFDDYKNSYTDYLAGAKLAGSISDKELEKYLPKPTTPENLKSFIIPAIVHIQNKKHCKEGTIGIEFDCTWDIENGLGVKIENWKVVQVGTGQTSYFFN